MLIMNADLSGVAASVSSLYQVARCARSAAEIWGMMRGSGGPLSISNSLKTVIPPRLTGFMCPPTPARTYTSAALRACGHPWRERRPRLDGGGFNQEEAQYATDRTGGCHQQYGRRLL